MNGPHWIKQWIADLAVLNEQFRDDNGTVDFEALGREEFQFRTALITRNFSKSERAKVVFEQAAAAYQINVERGKKGGRPRKDVTTPDDKHDDPSTALSEDRQDPTRAVTAVPELRRAAHSPATARTSGPKFDNKEEFIQWAIDKGLDASDANECWEATVERGWKDADGNDVKNMRAFAMQWCRTRAKNRRSA